MMARLLTGDVSLTTSISQILGRILIRIVPDDPAFGQCLCEAKLAQGGQLGGLSEGEYFALIKGTGQFDQKARLPFRILEFAWPVEFRRILQGSLAWDSMACRLSQCKSTAVRSIIPRWAFHPCFSSTTLIPPPAHTRAKGGSPPGAALCVSTPQPSLSNKHHESLHHHTDPDPAPENDGTYGLTTDWWNDHVAREVGTDYGRLLQSYGVQKTMREARRRGLRSTRRVEADGTILLTLEGGAL